VLTLLFYSFSVCPLPARSGYRRSGDQDLVTLIMPLSRALDVRPSVRLHPGWIDLQLCLTCL